MIHPNTVPVATVVLAQLLTLWDLSVYGPTGWVVMGCAAAGCEAETHSSLTAVLK